MTAPALQTFFWERPKETSFLSGQSSGEYQLSDQVLIRNATWYVRLRWISISFLVLYFFTSLVPQAISVFNGMKPQGAWPLFLGIWLTITNTLFFAFSHNRKFWKVFPPVAQIWAQIVIDLLAIAIVVHFCGSIATPAPFLYVLHIALACIFFPTKKSVVIPVIASLLYCGCIGLEYCHIIIPHTEFAPGIMTNSNYTAYGPSVLWQVATTTVIFFLLWYMVSRLSSIIRLRESQLIFANKETRRLHQEKEQYSVQMTHQLKNPLDAIRSNISLLLYYKEQEMPPGASDLLHRIDVRAKGMANLIVDVLKLSRLNAPVEKLVMQQVDIHEIVKTAVDELKSSAGSRKVTIETLLNQASVPGIADHYKMLVENLLANAITYSHDGGHVSIVCSTDEALNCAVMSVTDQGIGIAEDKLPHIFDEYFRTKEAITHNRASTGIGLAIVKKIAQTYGIQVSIKSELGKGTTVTAVFPRVQTSNAGPTAIAQETDASTIDQ